MTISSGDIAPVSPPSIVHVGCTRDLIVSGTFCFVGAPIVYWGVVKCLSLHDTGIVGRGWLIILLRATPHFFAQQVEFVRVLRWQADEL